MLGFAEPCRRPVLALLLSLLLATVACHRIHGETLVILGEGEGASVRGEVSFAINPASGQMEPELRKPGVLYVFRAEHSVGDVTGKAGEVYKVTEGGNLVKAGDFDLSKTDDELAKAFGVD